MEGSPVAPTARHLARSQSLLARARAVIPGATQTISKGHSQWVSGLAPVFAERGRGPFVWDVDGNRYYDLPMALGPVILGHAHPAVTRAVEAAIANGVTFTLPHPLEVEVAERVVQLVPGAEMVRFGKSGSDAVSAAIRLARAFTGRDHIGFSGYHGWHDWHIGATTRALGVPTAVSELSHGFEFGDLASLDAVLESRPGEFAALVIEPAGSHEPPPGFLEGLRERAEAHRALVIFDEVITGFRLAPGGAQAHYGVPADLACFGKAMANGMPLSAVAGREELMRLFEHEIFVSGTHGGEIASLAACRATLDVIVEEDVCEGLWRRGAALTTAINEAAERHGMVDAVAATGAAPRSVVAPAEPDPASETAARTYLQQELVKRGVLFNGSNFISHAHTDEHITEIAAAYDEAIARLAAVWPDRIAAALEAPPLAPVFRRA
jgi:glutamate-1-semialdehyde aminotransferase